MTRNNSYASQVWSKEQYEYVRGDIFQHLDFGSIKNKQNKYYKN